MARYLVSMVKMLCALALVITPLVLGTLYLTKKAEKSAPSQVMRSEALPPPVGDDTDISAVKSHWVSYGGVMDLPYVERKIGDAVANLAGIDGKVAWNTVASSKYKHNPAVVCVQATIDVPAHGKARQKQMIVRLFRNRETGVIDLDSLKINGKSSKIPAMDLMYGVRD